MLGTELFLPLSFLPPLEGTKFYYHEIIGFQVKDTRFGDVGVIVGVNDKTAQHLFVIENLGKEILIPVNDLFIKQVDRENKILGLDVPEGLIELYL
jgi:16S rRNA processing protein RimM